MDSSSSEQISHLTQVRFVDVHKGKSRYLYKCRCGMFKVLRKADVRSGRVKSCGCWRIEMGVRNTKNLEQGKDTQFKPGHSMNHGNEFWKKRKNHVSGTKGKKRYEKEGGGYYFK